ncbi:neuronal acetylcholine receptor subunit alpha-7-like [Zeugodacus cucurbitae]|uniref:neuronal acetylcholine receptor subunit alpha-7-like n=1 Tax=Zeugodacus cucurbitae TaxID=28588 RepID=UPI0023D9228F|nr:neuronal acetylcholine receptor subunit alpha-7-like [Zeugodacus cucurbitae]
MNLIVATMSFLKASSHQKATITLTALSWLLLGLGLIISLPVCTAGPHEKRLLHALLDNYNSLERSVVNESDPLQLSFGLTLMQIIDVEWNDMNMRWNSSEYGGIRDLRIPTHRLWNPDVLNRKKLRISHYEINI